MRDLCEWTELPQDHCPHCTGDLSVLDVVCNHGQLAAVCDKCPYGAPREDRGIRPERITLTGMQMGALKLQENDYHTVLGPCPGCQSWQIDYTDEVVAQFAEFVTEDVYEVSSEEPIDTVRTINLQPFHAVVEDALREHLDECPHLQRLVGEL